MTGPARIAKAIAEKSPSRFRLGAVIARKGRVLSVGFNQMDKTHPRSANKYPYLHAELHALIGLGLNQTKGSDLFVCRLTRNGEEAIAKPCEYCMAAIRAAGVRRVYYSVVSGWIEEKV